MYIIQAHSNLNLNSRSRIFKYNFYIFSISMSEMVCILNDYRTVEYVQVKPHAPNYLQGLHYMDAEFLNLFFSYILIELY